MKSWTVKSTSDPKKNYKVTKVTEYDWQCTCPDSTIRHRVCKHIKGVQKAYDKQNQKNKPAPNRGQNTPVQSDDRGHGQKGSNLPNGELRGSDMLDGNPAGIHEGNEPNGGPGPDNSGESPETSVGTPDAGAVEPGSAEGSDPTPPDDDQEVCRADDERKQREAKRKAQTKQLDIWLHRETRYSKELFPKLQALRDAAKLHPEKVDILKLQAKPLKVAIRMANARLGEKPPFDISLVDEKPEEKDEFVVQVEEALF